MCIIYFFGVEYFDYSSGGWLWQNRASHSARGVQNPRNNNYADLVTGVENMDNK